MGKNSRIMRVHEKFLKEIQDMKIERLKSGIDIKPKSNERITLALTRSFPFKKSKKDVINSKLAKE